MRLSHKKYLILYTVIGNQVYIFYIQPSKMNTRAPKHIKKSAFADFFNVLFLVYVVVHQIHHLRRWYQEFVLVHAHRFDLVLMLCPLKQRS